MGRTIRWSRKDAQLFSSSELSLIQSSRRPAVTKATIAQLTRLIDRMRKQAGKYRDLSRAQGRTSKRTTAVSSTRLLGNIRTARKAALSSHILDQLTTELAAAQHREQRRTSPRRRKSTANLTRGAAKQQKALRSKRQGLQAASRASRGARKTEQLLRSGTRARQSGTSAAGRRRQAKRDAR